MITQPRSAQNCWRDRMRSWKVCELMGLAGFEKTRSIPEWVCVHVWCGSSNEVGGDLTQVKIDNRCDWCGTDPLYVDYHDREWGRPLVDPTRLFEFLILEGAQAGLAWITILRKREAYIEAFDGFDPERIARFSERDIELLMKNEGIVRNRRKLDSAVRNARAWLELDDPVSFMWSFVGGGPIQNRFRRMDEVPASTTDSTTMSKTLRKRGFNFVGPTICYAFMQATGMVNDHLLGCDCHDPCRAEAEKVVIP